MRTVEADWRDPGEELAAARRLLERLNLALGSGPSCLLESSCKPLDVLLEGLRMGPGVV